MSENGRSERAERYRFRAEELRTLCETWMDRQTREIIDRVARDYDRMAAHLERDETPTTH